MNLSGNRTKRLWYEMGLNVDGRDKKQFVNIPVINVEWYW